MIKQTIKKHLINARGTRLNSKVVVFESDDWGSVRIPSNAVRSQLIDKNLIKENDPFSKYDTLETAADYFALYEIFERFKDRNGNQPILTANVIMNNPDFIKIKSDNFTNYHSESFIDTYRNFQNSGNAFDALKIGIDQKMIVPQFHGREHLNVRRWMQFLTDGNERYKFAFDRNCFSIDEESADNRRGNLMAAYDYNNNEELAYIQKSIKQGLAEFKNIFGFKSKTTVAPCYVWDEKVEDAFRMSEVETFQGSYLQNCPVPGKDFQKRYRYSGQVNNLGQRYLVRNSLFEPSITKSSQWVSKCMESIDIAFKWRQPAIIGTHRINFCSRLDENKRTENLNDLQELLSQMLKKWPDLEFMDSASLSSKYE